MPRKTTERVVGCAAAGVASMRPRPDAAENAAANVSDVILPAGFNEAAARCRGKR